MKTIKKIMKTYSTQNLKKTNNFRNNNTVINNLDLKIVNCLYLCLEFQNRLGRVGVCLHDDTFVLESFVAFAVVCNADATFVTRFYWIFREFYVGASARSLNSGDYQRSVACVLEFVGKRHLLALNHLAEIVFQDLEFNFRFFGVFAFRSRRRIVHQTSVDFIVIVAARPHQNNQ